MSDRPHPRLNAWCGLPDALSAEILARAGFDSVTVDMQHGLHDLASAVESFRAIALHGAVPFVRVPWNEPGLIMRVLDAGAVGVICPMISTPEDAKRFAGACLYPPRGYRSYGPVRAGLMHEGYVPRAHDIVLSFGMIETREGFDRVEEIVATPGLTGVYIGPSDLSLAFGEEPRQDRLEPEFLARVDRIREAAHAAGKLCGIHAATAAYARQMQARGFDLVTPAGDTVILAAGAAAALKVARGEA